MSLLILNLYYYYRLRYFFLQIIPNKTVYWCSSYSVIVVNNFKTLQKLIQVRFSNRNTWLICFNRSIMSNDHVNWQGAYTNYLPSQSSLSKTRSTVVLIRNYIRFWSGICCTLYTYCDLLVQKTVMQKVSLPPYEHELFHSHHTWLIKSTTLLLLLRHCTRQSNNLIRLPNSKWKWIKPHIIQLLTVWSQ